MCLPVTQSVCHGWMFQDAESDLAKQEAEAERARAKEEAAAARSGVKKVRSLVTPCWTRRAQTLSALPTQPDEDKAAEEDGQIVEGTLKTLRTNDAYEIMKIIRQRRKKRGSISAGV